jgi:hypothetical protein
MMLGHTIWFRGPHDERRSQVEQSCQQPYSSISLGKEVPG